MNPFRRWVDLPPGLTLPEPEPDATEEEKEKYFTWLREQIDKYQFDPDRLFPVDDEPEPPVFEFPPIREIIEKVPVPLPFWDLTEPAREYYADLGKNLIDDVEEWWAKPAEVWIPGFSDIVHVKTKYRYTPEEAVELQKPYEKRDWDKVSEGAKAEYWRRVAVAKRMAASPTPGFVRSIGQIMTFLDDTEDAITTAAVFGRIIIKVAPRIFGRFIPIVGWMFVGADIINFFNIFRHLPFSPKGGKRRAWDVETSCPFTKKGRLKSYDRAHVVMHGKSFFKIIKRFPVLGKYASYMPSMPEMIEIAQTSDMLFGIGLCLGPIIGGIEDTIFGLIKAPQTVWHWEMPTDVQRVALRALKHIPFLLIEDATLTDEDKERAILTFRCSLEIVKPLFMHEGIPAYLEYLNEIPISSDGSSRVMKYTVLGDLRGDAAGQLYMPDGTPLQMWCGTPTNTQFYTWNPGPENELSLAGWIKQAYLDLLGIHPDVQVYEIYPPAMWYLYGQAYINNLWAYGRRNKHTYEGYVTGAIASQIGMEAIDLISGGSTAWEVSTTDIATIIRTSLEYEILPPMRATNVEIEIYLMSCQQYWDLESGEGRYRMMRDIAIKLWGAPDPELMKLGISPSEANWKEYYRMGKFPFGEPVGLAKELWPEFDQMTLPEKDELRRWGIYFN